MQLHQKGLCCILLGKAVQEVSSKGTFGTLETSKVWKGLCRPTTQELLVQFYLGLPWILCGALSSYRITRWWLYRVSPETSGKIGGIQESRETPVPLQDSGLVRGSIFRLVRHCALLWESPIAETSKAGPLGGSSPTSGWSVLCPFSNLNSCFILVLATFSTYDSNPVRDTEVKMQGCGLWVDSIQSCLTETKLLLWLRTAVLILSICWFCF